MKIGENEKILLLLILLAFVLRMLLINQDISILLSKFLVDDAYYAYSIAENIVEDKGIVFNDGITTNGFHPLYNLVILVPLFKIFYNFGVNAPIYASLVILATFTVGTSIFLYLVVSRLLNKDAGLLSAFIWLFNPYVLFVSLIGVEAPIQIFFISLLTYFLLIRNTRDRFSIKESIVIGLLIGLVFLSRMDGVFIGIGIITTLFIRELIKNKGFKPIRFMKRFNIITIIITATLLVLPWLIWNLVELGRLTPISGEANRLLASFHLDDKSYTGLVQHAIYSTFGFVAKFFLQVTDNILQGIIIIFLALITPFIILLLKKDQFLLKIFFSLDFLFVSSLLLYLFYWFYQLGMREWYSMNTNFLLSIIFPLMIIRISQYFRIEHLRKVLNGAIVCILVLSFIYGGVIHYKRGNAPQEKLKWEVSNFINQNLPTDEIIGSFNSGIYQYYTKYHDIINLDGVVNPEALEAMKIPDGIENYILDKNISYIVDRPGYAQTVNKSILFFEPIKTFEMNYFSYKKTLEGKEVISIFRVVPNITQG